WYYFPVGAFYKVPLAIAGELLMPIASGFIRRPTCDELGVLAPALLTAARPLHPIINNGFRHALPLFVFLLLWSTRLTVRPAMVWLGWAAVAVTQAQMWSAMPNLLSFINVPRQHVWRHISDSNLDWGQAVRQARMWVDDNDP